MWGTLFYWVLNMSILASFFGTLVLLVDRCRWFPRRQICWLWAVPFLRMLFPWGIRSRFSLMTWLDGLLAPLIQRHVAVNVPVAKASSSAMVCCNVMQMTDTYMPMTYRVSLWEKVFQVAGYLWLAGVCVLLTVYATAYIHIRYTLRDARPGPSGTYLSDKVRTPAVYGVFRPRVVLPTAMAEQLTQEQWDYMLLHERAHIRRGDNLWRLLALLITCVHWFNPLAWLFLRRFIAAMEKACDEQVLSCLEEGQRKTYAHVLLSMAVMQLRSRQKNGWGDAGETHVPASPFCSGGLRSRLFWILSYRQLSRLAWVGCGIFLLTIAWLFLTNLA